MTQTTEKQDDPFIIKLLKLSQDRGSLSHLRRYWSESTMHYAYPILGRLGVPDRRRPDAITAALFSMSPHHKLGAVNIGTACRKLAGENGMESMEKHFRRLLACESLEEVADRLSRLFKRMDRESILLDYNRLMWDLRNWDKKASDIKARWAMDFWQAPAELSPSLES